MENRALKPPRQGVGQVSPPLDREAVLAQRLVLGLELGGLRGVDGQAEAARAAKSVAGQLFEPVEVPLGEHPEASSPLGAELLARDVVRGRAATQREAAVALARPAGYLAGLEQAHALAGLRELERAGAARDTTTHDRDVDRARRPFEQGRKRRVRL